MGAIQRVFEALGRVLGIGGYFLVWTIVFGIPTYWNAVDGQAVDAVVGGLTFAAPFVLGAVLLYRRARTGNDAAVMGATAGT